jgi:hypothetical protein
MSEYATTWLVQYEPAKALVLLYKPTLFPQTVTGRWCNPANNHIANLAFGVTTDNMDNFA